jgi:hypothetical protein
LLILKSCESCQKKPRLKEAVETWQNELGNSFYVY